MADNVVANPGAGGATFATDDIGGVHYPRSKVAWGADGVAADVADSGGSRLPVKVGDALPAGTNNIGDVDVLTLPALPAGTNNIGDVDVLTLPALPAGTNNIGDVDVLTLPAGSVAAATAKTADYDTGGGTDTVPMFGVALPASGGAVAGGTATNPLRTDPTGTTPQPVTDAGGSLTVDGSVTATQATASNLKAQVQLIDGSGDSAMDDANDAVRVNIVAGAGSGGTALADGATFTPNTTSLTPVGGYRDDVTPATVTEGDAAAFRITENRALHVNLRDASGAEVSVGGGTQYDEDTASAPADKITMAGVVRADTAASLVGTDGDRTQLIVDASGRLHVNGSGVTQPVSGTVTANAGSNLNTSALALESGGNLAGAATSLAVLDDWDESDRAKVNLIVGQAGVQGGSGAVSATTQRVVLATDVALPAGTNNIGDVDVLTLPGVAGDVAHDAGDSGNPVKQGAVARTSDPASVASGDRVNLIATLGGKQIVHPYALPENLVSGVTAAITGTSDTSVIAAGGSGIRNYITQILVTNSHATVGTVVEIKDNTTVIYRGYAAPAGGGFALTFPAPLRLGDNVALQAANVTTGSNTYVSASGYRAP